LDLGCGDGALLARLVAEKNVTARGVEISEIMSGLCSLPAVCRCGMAISKKGSLTTAITHWIMSFSARRSRNLNQPAPGFQEMLRVGRHAVISFETPVYWRARWRAACGDGLGNPLASVSRVSEPSRWDNSASLVAAWVRESKNESSSFSVAGD
jgi:SAM-dependent methyltransferase